MDFIIFLTCFSYVHLSGLDFLCFCRRDKDLYLHEVVFIYLIGSVILPICLVKKIVDEPILKRKPKGE